MHAHVAFKSIYGAKFRHMYVHMPALWLMPSASCPRHSFSENKRLKLSMKLMHRNADAGDGMHDR